MRKPLIALNAFYKGIKLGFIVIYFLFFHLTIVNITQQATALNSPEYNHQSYPIHRYHPNYHFYRHN